MPDTKVDSRNLRGLLVAVLVSWFLWDTPVLYPVRLFATFCHEAGHAMAAILTGGQVSHIAIAPNGAGVTWSAGGWRLAVASGGYVGSVLFGCGILLLASHRRFSRYVLEALGAFMLILTLLYCWRDPFTFAYGLITGAALWQVGRRASADVEFYVAQTLGVLTAGMALMDIRTLFPGAGILVGMEGGPGLTDAQALAAETWLPATFWAALWALISVVAIVCVLKLSLRRRSQL